MNQQIQNTGPTRGISMGWGGGVVCALGRGGKCIQQQPTNQPQEPREWARDYIYRLSIAAAAGVPC